MKNKKAHFFLKKFEANNFPLFSYRTFLIGFNSEVP